MTDKPTIVSYPGDGNTTLFTVPFDYLKREYVTVKVREEGSGVGAIIAQLTGGLYSFSFVTDKSISITPAPPQNSHVVIARETARDALVDFTDGSVLIEDDLDAATLQSLHIAQEVEDRVENGLMLDVFDGQWDAAEGRLKNLGDPLREGDAVTLRWVNENIDVAAVQAAKAASRASAELAEDHSDQAGEYLAQMQDVYYGAHATPPTVSPNGNPLVPGGRYYDTVLGEMRVYSGQVFHGPVRNATLYHRNTLEVFLDGPHWRPPSACHILSIDAYTDTTPSGGSVDIRVKVDGQGVQDVTISAGTSRTTVKNLAIPLGLNSRVQVDIISVSSLTPVKNLAVRFNYG